jgi:hypothetical protein
MSTNHYHFNLTFKVGLGYLQNYLLSIIDHSLFRDIDDSTEILRSSYFSY